MSCQVNIFNSQNFFLENFPDYAQKILNETLLVTSWPINNCVVAVVFIDEGLSLKLNKQYRKKDYIADVLSFSNNDVQNDLFQDEQDLGDIYVCYPKAKQQAQDYDHSLTRELSFLFLHGLLHNLGYDHETKAEEKVMFALQKKVLNKLNILRTKGEN